MGNNFEKYFIGKAAISKTLCNELIPIGKTKENMEKYGIASEDELRSENYEEVKSIIDDFHRNFIENALGSSDIDWEELFDIMSKCRKDNNESINKELVKVQGKKRKQVVKCFTSRIEYKKMFKKELFTELLPEFIENNKEYNDEEKESKMLKLQQFQSFSSYFTGFNQNRQNIYADDESTAISYRTVNENAAIFLDNIEAYNRIIQELGIDILKSDNNLYMQLAGWKLENVYTKSFFGLLMIQINITHYNNVCGAINSVINEYCQKNKLNNRYFQMKKLYKQILSITESSFEIPSKFESDEEVYNAVNVFISSIKDENVLNKIKNLCNDVQNYDMSNVYIDAKCLTEVSINLFKDWNFINKCIYNDLESKVNGSDEKKKEKIEKLIKRKNYYNISELNECINKYIISQEMEDIVKCTNVLEYFDKIKNQVDCIEVKQIEKNDKICLIQDDDETYRIKEVLDKYQNLYHFLKPFMVYENIPKNFEFYIEYEAIMRQMELIIPLYNKVRNYVTQKPYVKKKIKLNFGIPTLANGWDQNKEYQNNCIILMKDKKFFLGVLNAQNKPNKGTLIGTVKPSDNSDYKKMVYKLLPGPNKMLPKVFFCNKWKEQHQVPDEIIKGYELGIYKKGDNFDLNFCHKLIDFFKKSINEYEDWSKFNFVFSETSKYQDISEFYREISEQGYKISFEYLSENVINNLVNEGKLYLFQIYNKDFAEGKREGSKDNLHTLYLKNLFSEENLKDIVLKLNGEAELFYRKSSISEPFVHKRGEVLVNKQYIINGTDGKDLYVPIPDDIYVELLNYYNGKVCGDISDKAKSYLSKAIVKNVKHEIIKDRRFTYDKMFFHMPITINYKATERVNLNEISQRYIYENFSNMHIIGIDRGERNLIYISVIDKNGVIKLQKSFNILNGYNYHKKLDNMENERDANRKSWRQIGTIKEVKEGYLSQVVHEIIKLMIDYNAVIVMENLNSGFKNSRKKVEKQVYQKFETMLIEKLNYVVLKENDVDKPGGILRGYQMAYMPDSIKNIGKQCGMIFYVPAAYTSKIDPTTGFVDIFDYAKYQTSIKAQKEFLLKFKHIKYDSNMDMFEFKFDYSNFRPQNSMAKQEWSAYTYGTRIKHIGEKHQICEEISPKENIKKALEENEINYLDGHDLRKEIVELDERKNKKLINTLFFSFKDTLQMRNSKPNDTEVDYIISPVINKFGEFFISNNMDDSKLPSNADANGAYHIALKGLCLINDIRNNWTEEEKLELNKIDLSNKRWFDFVQNRRFEENNV